MTAGREQRHLRRRKCGFDPGNVFVSQQKIVAIQNEPDSALKSSRTSTGTPLAKKSPNIVHFTRFGGI